MPESVEIPAPVSTATRRLASNATSSGDSTESRLAEAVGGDGELGGHMSDSRAPLDEIGKRLDDLLDVGYQCVGVGML
jgi:hypothetical protein